jgi:predicted RNase H-like nuclease (RuvC/YqgF family)
LTEQEDDLKQLRSQVEAFPKQQEIAVDKAVKEAVARVQREAQSREDMLKKDADGEKKVLLSRIEALQGAVKDLTAQNAKLSAQVERAYEQVQGIATKAVEGSGAQAVAAIHARSSETSRRGGAEDK